MADPGDARQQAAAGMRETAEMTLEMKGALNYDYVAVMNARNVLLLLVRVQELTDERDQAQQERDEYRLRWGKASRERTEARRRVQEAERALRDEVGKRHGRVDGRSLTGEQVETLFQKALADARVGGYVQE